MQPPGPSLDWRSQEGVLFIPKIRLNAHILEGGELFPVGRFSKCRGSAHLVLPPPSLPHSAPHPAHHLLSITPARWKIARFGTTPELIRFCLFPPAAVGRFPGWVGGGLRSSLRLPDGQRLFALTGFSVDLHPRDISAANDIRVPTSCTWMAIVVASVGTRLLPFLPRRREPPAPPSRPLSAGILGPLKKTPSCLQRAATCPPPVVHPGPYATSRLQEPGLQVCWPHLRSKPSSISPSTSPGALAPLVPCLPLHRAFTHGSFDRRTSRSRGLMSADVSLHSLVLTVLQGQSLNLTSGHLLDFFFFFFSWHTL